VGRVVSQHLGWISQPVSLAGAALALVGALAAGCATSAQGLPPAADGSTPPVPASPTPSGVALGRPAQADNGQVQATVFGYRAPLPAGTGWGAADVQVCVDQTTIFDVSVSRAPWQLVTADGRTVDASLTADARFPQPAYPTDHRRLHPGDCVRGWIVFALPSGGQAAAVQYAPAGAPAVRWTVR
jgi:hypothetical protein